MQRLVIALAVSCCLVGTLAGADDASEPKAIIDKAIKALGGEERMAKLQAQTWKAKSIVHGPGVDIHMTEDGAAQRTHQFRVEVTQEANGNRFSQVQVLNGDKGWTTQGNQTVEIPIKLLESMKNDQLRRALVEMPMLLKDKEFLKDKQILLSPLGEIKIGERAAIGVQITRGNGPVINLFFDKESGLPAKSETRTREMAKDVVNEFVYSDYKDFDGLKRFTKMTWSKDGKLFGEKEWTEIKPLDKLDDGTFSKP